MNEINVSYATSQKYVPIMLTSIVSCIESNANNRMMFHLFLDDVDEASIKRIKDVLGNYKNIKYNMYNVKDELDKLIQSGITSHRDMSYTTYSRILVPQLIPKEVSRLIHIDSDTLVVGDLTELYKLDLCDKLMGMAIDFISSDYKKILGLRNEDIYYNAGIILFDTERWKKNNVTAKILDILGKEQFKIVEQDVLNKYFQNEITRISFKYNFQTSVDVFDYKEIINIYKFDSSDLSENVFNDCKKSPIIMHFAGIMFSRPFSKDFFHPRKKLYMTYFNKVSDDKNELIDIKLPIYYGIQVIIYRMKWRKLLVNYTKILQKLFIIKNRI